MAILFFAMLWALKELVFSLVIYRIDKFFKIYLIMFGLISAVKLFYFLNFTLKGFTPLKKTGFQIPQFSGARFRIGLFFEVVNFYKDLRPRKPSSLYSDSI